MSAMETNRRRNLGQGGLGFDRISEIPREILSYIFSFLSMEDYAKTMLVSKTWNSIWSPRRVLELDFKSFYNTLDISNPAEREKRFAQFVERMTVLHKGLHLQELKFGFDVTLFRMSSSVIHNWITLASTTNPSTLDLKVYGIRRRNVDLSMFLWSCVGQSVTVVRLTRVTFIAQYVLNYKGFESVKTIILNTVQLPENHISYLIDKCPVLEELRIIECVHPFNLYVNATGSKLQLLDLELGYGCRLRDLKINIPSLVKLKFEGPMLQYFYVENLRNLIEARIHFTGGYDYLYSHNLVHTLLAGINNVNTLTLCTCSLKLTGSRGSERNQDELLQPQLNNLKNLTVIACRGCSHLRGCYEIKGLAYLLKSSPYLESLSVNLEPKLISFDTNSQFKYKMELVPFGCLNHLKKVEIAGFEGVCSQLEFVKYLLENALVLKSVIIYKPTRKSTFTPLHPSSEEDQYQEKAIDEVLSFKRACPDSQILIS